MTIIYNDKKTYAFSQLLFYRNGQRVKGQRGEQGQYVFEAERGDQIALRLKCLNHPSLPLASFVCEGEDERVSVSLKKWFSGWVVLNFRLFPKVFFGLFALFFLWRSVWVESSIVALFVLIVLSVLTLRLSSLTAGARQKWTNIRKEKVGA